MIRRFPTYPREVFADTSALFAHIDKDDDYHESVLRRLEEIVAQGSAIVVTNFILAELHALLLTRFHRQLAFMSVNRLRESSDVVVVRVTEVDEYRAWEIIEQFTDKDFSFTDATSFAVMERLAITHAISLDAHFAQFGWVMLQVERR